MSGMGILASRELGETGKKRKRVGFNEDMNMMGWKGKRDSLR